MPVKLQASYFCCMLDSCRLTRPASSSGTCILQLSAARLLYTCCPSIHIETSIWASTAQAAAASCYGQKGVRCSSEGREAHVRLLLLSSKMSSELARKLGTEPVSWLCATE